MGMQVSRRRSTACCRSLAELAIFKYILKGGIIRIVGILPSLTTHRWPTKQVP